MRISTPPTNQHAVGNGLRLLVAGAMLFGGASCALIFRPSDLNAAGFSIAMSLTPMVISVASSVRNETAYEGITGRIWPSLAAVVGLLLLFAQPALADVRSDLTYLFAPILTGTGAVLFGVGPHRAEVRVALSLAGGCLFFAVSLAVAMFFGNPFQAISIVTVASDGLLILLSVVSLIQVGPSKWSAQFILVPLLIVLEGIILVHPRLTAQVIVGLILLAASSVSLLLSKVDEQDESSYRDLTLNR